MKNNLNRKNNITTKIRGNVSSNGFVTKNKLTKEEKYLIDNVGNAIKRLSKV